MIGFQETTKITQRDDFMAFDYFGGTDPGKTGGHAILSAKREVIAYMPMGTLDETINFYSAVKGSLLVMIEKAQCMPKNGAVGMFNYGQGYGEILGALSALGIPHITVPPRTWTKRMHEGIPRDLEPKARSLAAMCHLFPGFDLKATPRCKKHHEGMIDAMLIAEYGRLIHVNSGLLESNDMH